MYQILNEGDKATLVLSGEVDLQTTAELKAEIAALGGISALNINAESVNYIDSSGIAILLMMRQHCLASNIIFTMSVISQPVFRVLQLAKLHEFLPIEAISATPSTGADNYGFESLPSRGGASGEHNRATAHRGDIAPPAIDMDSGDMDSGDMDSGDMDSDDMDSVADGFKLGDFR